MFKIIKTPLLFTTALALLATTIPSPLRAQDGSAPSEPIGFIELEGIGRFDIHPIEKGILPGVEYANMTDFSHSTAFWYGSSNPGRGGKLLILALRDVDDPTQGSVWVEYWLLDGRDGLDQVQSRGITYWEPHEAGTKPGRGWHLRLTDEVSIEEMSLEGEGPMTLKLRFAGKANRGNFAGGPSSEVVLKGVLEVEGLPYATK